MAEFSSAQLALAAVAYDEAVGSPPVPAWGVFAAAVSLSCAPVDAVNALLAAHLLEFRSYVPRDNPRVQSTMRLERA